MGSQQQTRFVVRAIYGNDNKARRVARFLRALFEKLSISRKFRVASIDMQQITGIATPGLFALTINKCMSERSGAGNARQRNFVAFFLLSRWKNHRNSRLSKHNTHQQFSFLIWVRSDCLLRAIIISSVKRAIVNVFDSIHSANDFNINKFRVLGF